ncbi:uncharacterized protein LOC119310842 isoform X1 [Triticum dicoccoides]|uniref:uncharacterized protein LOC119310842 isoform X1 n=2 Tax=Triticum dicoccoides TaxID=85692 RepID=UPI001890C2EC|nr:uncharacterized protein LOC119310842 isoform X1 [Triticum dicoccoides]
MGLLVLQRFLSLRRGRRRRQTRAHGTSIASVAKRKGSPCEQGDSSQDGKRMRLSGPDLPMDIWHHISSLLPMRDAARASCVSCAFECSWRYYPNLTFCTSKMSLNGQHFVNKVDQIMKKHSGIGMKTFEFEYNGPCFDTSKLNDWLQIAVTSGIEELEISLYLANKAEHYNFPCSLLFSGSGGNSIRRLDLSGCAFHPMAGLGCLTRLDLLSVHITEDELGCLLSSSFALEELHLTECSDIICLKIPCLLHRLSKLNVSDCDALKGIENKAPNLRTVSIDSYIVHHSIGDSLRVKDLEMVRFSEFNLIHHTCAKLPACMPNLETLSIRSTGEMFSTPSAPLEFFHLKQLDIRLDAESGAFSPNSDYFSLVVFLDACPILETFRLEVIQTRMKHVSVLQDSSHLRQIPGLRHGNIKKVEIIGFCSAKSMVELTCHILENATSLECLTLDTISGGIGIGDVDAYRLNRHKFGVCFSEGRHMIVEAHKAVLAIERHVMVKVPSTVKLNVIKPCSRCHVV